MNTLFQRVVLSRLWLTFIVLGVSFVVFAGGTVNLGFTFMANSQLLRDYGWQAVMDGGLQQSIELILKSVVSIAAYVVFKACEHHLSHWLSHGATTPSRGHGDGNVSGPSSSV